MLVDLTYNKKEINRLNEIFKKENLGSAKDLYPFLEDERTYHPNKGCYIGNGFNINTSLFVETKGKSESCMGYLGKTDNPALIRDYNGDLIPNPNWFSQYGVCDNVEQVLEKYKEILEGYEHQYFGWFTPVFQEKENAGKGGGWRWHKWGPYIGELERRCEYLDDEEFGDDWCGYVLCFHIYRIDYTENDTFGLPD